jgi:hypothetical protein
MTSREETVQKYKPYIEELAKRYNGYVHEKCPIVFGHSYNPEVDEYDLVLDVEEDFSLGVRFSKRGEEIGYFVSAFFTVSLDGKRYRNYKPMGSGVLTEENFKGMIQNFITAYNKERKEFVISP